VILQNKYLVNEVIEAYIQKNCGSCNMAFAVTLKANCKTRCFSIQIYTVT